MNRRELLVSGAAAGVVGVSGRSAATHWGFVPSVEWRLVAEGAGHLVET